MEHFTEWSGTPKEAIAFQEELRKKVSIEPFTKDIKFIGGADVSLNMFSTDLYAGIIVLSFPDLVPVAHAVVKTKTTFPYIPGLLSFREVPGLLFCWEKLNIKPDVLVVDGQGITHPRRLGIASHVGAVLDIPTIGCAKSPLYGKTEPHSTEVGTSAEIFDPKNKEVIGTMLYTKKRAKPLIISPGHKMSVKDSARIIEECSMGYRLPEPTRQAHMLVNKFRTGTL